MFRMERLAWGATLALTQKVYKGQSSLLVEVPGHYIIEHLDATPGDRDGGDFLRVRISGPNLDDADRIVNRSLILELPRNGGTTNRIETAGLLLSVDDGLALVEEPFPSTPLFQQLGGFDFHADQPVTLDVVLSKYRTARLVTGFT